MDWFREFYNSSNIGVDMFQQLFIFEDQVTQVYFGRPALHGVALYVRNCRLYRVAGSFTVASQRTETS